MKPGDTKIGIRVWTPLLEKFGQRLRSACLRRDSYLTKVLQGELDELDGEISEPNSEAARQFITTRLDALPRKLMTLTLPEELVRRLDDICERKRIVRDSYFNRLLFLLLGDRERVNHLFFEDNGGWLQDVFERTDFPYSDVPDLLDPIPDFRDPFAMIRLGLEVTHSRLTKEETEEFGNVRDSDTWLSRHKIYTAPITQATFPKIDLSGLNVYLPDRLVPGTAEHHKRETLFDDLLAFADEEPTEERQP